MRGRPARFQARVGALVSGYLLDQLAGELPSPFHPLPHFGRLVGALEERLYSDAVGPGVAFAAVGALTAALAAMVTPSTTLATFLSCGGRALGEAASELESALASGNLEAARLAARSLVSRDTAALGEAELSRAAIESVAENSVDAVVAPLFFAALGGAPAVLAHRAANTLDATVGYHSPRYENFGWASARLDDLLAYLPARLVALLVAVVRPRQAGAVLDAVRRDAPSHPSPNAGVAEAAFAAALGLSLGGKNSYGGVLEDRPVMGRGRPAEAADIPRAVVLLREVGLAACALAIGVARLAPKSPRGAS